MLHHHSTTAQFPWTTVNGRIHKTYTHARNNNMNSSISNRWKFLILYDLRVSAAKGMPTLFEEKSAAGPSFWWCCCCWMVWLWLCAHYHNDNMHKKLCRQKNSVRKEARIRRRRWNPLIQIKWDFWRTLLECSVARIHRTTWARMRVPLLLFPFLRFLIRRHS